MKLIVADDEVLIEAWPPIGGLSASLDDFIRPVGHDTIYALVVFRGHQE